MLLNNVKLDLKTNFIEGQMAQTEIAEQVGISLLRESYRQGPGADRQ